MMKSSHSEAFWRLHFLLCGENVKYLFGIKGFDMFLFFLQVHLTFIFPGKMFKKHFLIYKHDLSGNANNPTLGITTAELACQRQTSHEARWLQVAAGPGTPG